MLSIRSNVASTSAQKNMTNVSNNLQKSMERLSSGFRINRAGDDAAGLAISEKLKSQVNGLMQAARNSGDGISMIQTAEGGMDEIQNMMQRMRDLAVSASNDTLGTSERMNIAQELDALRQEANNVATRTKFNGIGLLAGQLSGTVGGTSEVKLDQTIATAGTAATISTLDVSGASAGRTFKFSLGQAADTLTLSDATTGQAQTIQLADVSANSSTTLNFGQLGVSIKITSGATALDADNIETHFTTNTTSQTHEITTSTSGGAASLQSGANAGEVTSVSFADVRLSGGGNTDLTSLNTDIQTFAAAGGAGATQTNASALITRLDTALSFISTERAKLGAAQNRLEYSISSVKSQAGNLEASNSRIRDVDVAEESGAMARSNVLMQAGVSVLSQANQIPQLALKLLG
jgi:flagellin